MWLSVQAQRAAMRVAYAGLRTYWFVLRPQIVGVKCVLTHGDEVLLVRHTYGSRAWDLPGGTVRRREIPRETASREMEEELGREIEDWTSLGELLVHNNHHRDNVHLFHTRLADRNIDMNLAELSEADWFPRDALPSDLGRFVCQIVARVRAA